MTGRTSRLVLRVTLMLAGGAGFGVAAAVAGAALEGATPAFAAAATCSSVSNSGTVDTVTYGDGTTRISDVGGDLAVNGVGCSGFPLASITSVNFAAPGSAATGPTLAVDDRSTAFPCSITIGAADALPLTVYGASGKTVAAGASAVDPGGCNAAQITSSSDTSLDLVAGATGGITISAGGSSHLGAPVTVPVTLDGTADTTTPDTYVVGDPVAPGADTLEAAVAGSRVDYSLVQCPTSSTAACSIVMNSTNTTPATLPSGVAVGHAALVQGGTAVYNYDYSSSVADFLGATGNPTIPTTFWVSPSASTYAPSGNITLQGAGAGTIVAAPTGSGDTVAAGAATQTFTVTGNGVILQGGTGTAEFDVTGNNNTMQAGAGPDTFYDSGTGNTISFAGAGASSTEPLVVNDSGANQSVDGVSLQNGQAALATATPTVYVFRDSNTSSSSDSFNTIVGAASGNTVLLAGGTGGLSFQGSGTNNSAQFLGGTGVVADLNTAETVTTSLVGTPASPDVTNFQIGAGDVLVAPPSTGATIVGGKTIVPNSCAGSPIASICDSLVGVYNLTGPGSSTFYAGPAPNTYTFSDAGDGNTFYGGSGADNFSSAGNNNSFVVGTGSENLTETTTTGTPSNSINFSGAPAGSLVVNVSDQNTAVNRYSAAVFNSANAELATYSFGFDSGGPDFTSFTGASGGATTFQGGSGNYNYVGQGLGNTLDFSEYLPPTGTTTSLTFDVTHSPSPLATLGSVPETFSGITTLKGLSGGSTDFVGGSTGGYVFDGAGSGNQADFSGQQPSTTLTATVTSGSSAETSGSVTFSLAGGQILCSNVALNAAGVATCYATGLPSGTSQVVTVYNPPAGSTTIGSGTIVTAGTGAGSPNPTTLTVASPAGGTYYAGQSVTFQAAVAGATSGTVTFTQAGSSSPLCSSVAVDPSGVADCTVANGFGAGTYSVVASYRPTSGSTGSAGILSPFTVQAAHTTSVGSITYTAGFFFFGIPIDISCNGASDLDCLETSLTSPSGPVTGTLTFSAGGVTVCSVTGLTVTAAPQNEFCSPSANGVNIEVGEQILALFTPDGGQGFTGSANTVVIMSSPYSTVLTSTTTTLGSSTPTPSTGQPVTLTATVSGSLSVGDVTFEIAGGAPLCTVPLISGSASCPTTLPAGNQEQLLAIYSPPSGSSIADSVGTLVVTSVAAPPSSTTSASSAASDSAPGIFANLSGAPYTTGAGVSVPNVQIGADQVLVAAPATAGASCGSASAPASNCDSLIGINVVSGSDQGGNTFVAGAGSETFADSGTDTSGDIAGRPAGDTIDFSRVATGSPSSQLTVNVNGGNASYTATVAGGGPTYTFTTGGAGFRSFVGANQGYTDFLANANGGYTFTGYGPGDTVDLSAVGTGATVDLQPSTSAVTLPGGFVLDGGQVLVAPSGPGSCTATASSCDTLVSGSPGPGLTDVIGSSQGHTTFYGGTTTDTFTGSATGNYFYAGSGGDTFVDPNAGNTIDFSLLGSSVTVNVSGQLVSPTPNDGALASNSATYSFSGASTTFVGSPCGTDFLAGTIFDTFTGTAIACPAPGAPIANELDFSKIASPPAALTICLVKPDGSPCNLAELGTTNDPFSNITVFDGLAGGNTTFTAGSNGGYQFNAHGSNNSADFSSVTTGVVANLSGVDYFPAGGTSGPYVGAGQVLVTGAGTSCATAANCDTLSNVTVVAGSKSGGNTFVAGTTSETFSDTGAGNDTINFSQVPTGSAASLLTVNVSGGSSSYTASVLSGPTYTFTSGGSGFKNFVGSNQGYTYFLANSGGGYSFTGNGTGNTVDFSNLGTGAAVNLSGSTQTVSGFSLPAGRVLVTPAAGSCATDPGACDTISGLDTVTGSAQGYTTFFGGPATAVYNFTAYNTGNHIYAGPGTINVTDLSAGNTIDFSLLPTASVTINRSGQLVSPTPNNGATSSTGSTYTFGSAPTTFVGSVCGTLFYGGVNGDSFDGSPLAGCTGTPRSSGNELSFTQVYNPPSSLTVCLVASGPCLASQLSSFGTYALVGSTIDPFANITTFDGLTAGNSTFEAGSTGGYTFVGSGGNNLADYSGATSGIVANLSGATYTTLYPSTWPAGYTPGGITVGGSQVAVSGSCSSSTTACDTLRGAITSVTGWSGGGNEFVAGPGTETFGDNGTSTTDTIVFTNVFTTGGTPLIIDVTGVGAGGIGTYQATAGSYSYSFGANGTDFTNFVGSAEGNTHLYLPGGTAGYTFTAATGSSNNTVDLSASSGITANLSPTTESGLNAGQVQLTGTAGVDTISGANFLVGAAGGTNVFYGGLTGINFSSTSNDNQLSYAGLGATSTISVNLITDSVSPGTGTTGKADTFNFGAGALTITGSPGSNTFYIGPTSVTLQGGGSTSNVINLSKLTSGATVDLSGGTITNSAGSYTVDFALGCTDPTQLCVTQITGSPYSDTYVLSNAEYAGTSGLPVLAISGGSGPGDTIDLSQVTGPAAVYMPIGTTAGSVAASVGGTAFVTFTGVTTVDGTQSGGDTFFAGTGTETLTELATTPGILDLSLLPYGASDKSGAQVDVDTTSGSADGTVTRGGTSGSNITFTNFTTFDGTPGNDTFTQKGTGVLTYNGGGGTNTLDLTSVGVSLTVNFTTPAPTEGCSTGANDGSAVSSDGSTTVSFSCMSTVLASGVLYFNVSPGEDATLTGGGSGDLFLKGDTIGNGVTITLPNGSTPGSVVGDGYDFQFTGMSTVNGTPFNDLFVPGTGSVTIVGGGGNDGVSFAGAPNPVVVNLSGASYTVPAGYASAGTVVPAGTATGGYGGTVTLEGISNVTGTAGGNDILIGGSNPGTLNGGTGNVRFVLTGGDTSINAGTGQNTLDMSLLRTYTTVAVGDPLPQNTGAGTLTLEAGNIADVYASPAGSTIFGGNGTVNLYGGAGNDTLEAGIGTQTLSGGGGTDTLVGGIGNDTLVGGSQPSTFVPGQGNDTITSSASGNTLSYDGVPTGVDVNLTGNEYSVPAGELGAGTTLPGMTASGGWGATVSLAGANITTVVGSSANDIFVVGSGATVSGNGGNDLFVVDGGNNTLTAGAGSASTFLFVAAGGNVINGGGDATVDFSQVNTGTGVTVNLQAGSATGGFGGNQKLTGVLDIVGTQYSDVLVAGAPGATVTGGNGNDLLEAGPTGGDTLISGGNGADTFCAEASCAYAGTVAGGGDDMVGGSGNDTFFARNGEVDTINGGGGFNAAQVDPSDKVTAIQQLLP